MPREEGYPPEEQYTGFEYGLPNPKVLRMVWHIGVSLFLIGCSVAVYTQC